MFNEDNFWCRSVLDRLAVRRGEHVMSTLFGIVDVESIAAAANNHCVQPIIQRVDREAFEAICEGTISKSRLIRDNEAGNDFLPDQARSTLVAADLMDGTISLLDGARRGKEFFKRYPNGCAKVFLVHVEYVWKFAKELDPQSALGKLLTKLQERPLWHAAADSDGSGGDLLPFLVGNDLGRRKAEPIETYLDACSARFAFEIIDRAKKHEPDKIKDDYNGFLASTEANIGGRRYKAFHPLPVDDAENPPTKDAGRYANWKRSQKVAIRAHEGFFIELGVKPVPPFPIDPVSMSSEELRLMFVLATRAREAYRRNVSAMKYLARFERNRDGIPDADEIERTVFGTKKMQNEVWLDWPAQKALATGFGLNAAEFFPNMMFAHDILQWWSHTFFAERGLWRPIQMQSEAEQFMHWRALEQIGRKEEYEGLPATGHYLEWMLIFQALDRLPSAGHAKQYGWHTALEHAFHNCMASLERVSSLTKRL